MDQPSNIDEQFRFVIINDDTDNFLIYVENYDIESINCFDFEGIIKKAILIYSAYVSNQSLFDDKYFHCFQFKRGSYNSIYIEIDIIETDNDSINYIDIYCYTKNHLLLGKGGSVMNKIILEK